MPPKQNHGPLAFGEHFVYIAVMLWRALMNLKGPS
jgi:hypothetical protein